MNHTPSALQKLEIVKNHIEMFGWRRTVRDVLVHLLEQTPDDFDQLHGVSTRLTTGRVRPLEAGLGDPRSVDDGHGYEPTDPRVMAHVLRYVESHFTLPELSFVDLGCGRGRALLMASELPFQQVIGVELSASHCEAARENAEAYRVGSRTPRAPVRVCCEDVTTFVYPATDLLVYMFNPFRGAVLRGVLDGLAAFRREQRRNVHIVLSNPELEDLLLSHAAFARCHEHQVISLANSWNLWRCVDPPLSAPQNGALASNAEGLPASD